MESINLLNLFLISTGVLWIFLLTVAILMGNQALLRKRGYSEDYVSFISRDYFFRALIMGFAIPAIQVVAYLVVGLFTDDTSSSIDLVLLVFIILVLPFPVIDNILTRKKIKAIRKQSNETLVIDFKHKILNLIFNPFVELTLSIVVVLYSILVIKPVIIFYLHVILPWLFYLAARKSQLSIRSHIRDGYLWAFVFISINFGLVIYYLSNGLIKCHSQLSNSVSVIGIILVALLFSRLVYYFLSFPKVNQKLLAE